MTGTVQLGVLARDFSVMQKFYNMKYIKMFILKCYAKLNAHNLLKRYAKLTYKSSLLCVLISTHNCLEYCKQSWTYQQACSQPIFGSGRQGGKSWNAGRDS